MISNKEARKRLLLIARKTERVPPHRFNFQVYVGKGWGGKPDLSCGAAACSIGHASSLPYFRKRGLRLIQPFGVDGMVCAVAGNVNSYDDNYSVARMLGLNQHEYEYVFIPDEHDNGLTDSSTNKEVAAHIRKFVDNRFPLKRTKK